MCVKWSHSCAPPSPVCVCRPGWRGERIERGRCVQRGGQSSEVHRVRDLHTTGDWSAGPAQNSGPHAPTVCMVSLVSVVSVSVCVW